MKYPAIISGFVAVLLVVGGLLVISSGGSGDEGADASVATDALGDGEPPDETTVNAPTGSDQVAAVPSSTAAARIVASATTTTTTTIAPPTTAPPTTAPPTTAPPTSPPPATPPPTAPPAPSPSTAPTLGLAQAQDTFWWYLQASVRRDYETAWAILRPAYQDRYVGFAKFVDFWDSVADAGIRQCESNGASPGAHSLRCRVYYVRRRDGSVSNEVIEVDLVDIAGTVFIADYRFLYVE